MLQSLSEDRLGRSQLANLKFLTNGKTSEEDLFSAYKRQRPSCSFKAFATEEIRQIARKAQAERDSQKHDPTFGSLENGKFGGQGWRESPEPIYQGGRKPGLDYYDNV